VVLPLDHHAELLRVRGRSFGPDGTDVEVIGPQAIAYAESMNIPGIAFPDFREAIFDVPGASVGDVVEVETETLHATLHSISGFVFDDYVPVSSARLIVRAPADFELRWSHSRDGVLSKLVPAIEEDGGEKIYTFSQENLEARDEKKPDMLRVAVTRVPDEDISVFSSWDDLARWYHDLSQGLGQVSDEQWADVKREIGEPTAEKLFELVRDRIRYVAYYREGIDGLRPHAAGEALRLRFGDCKDMSTLLLALYERAGITGAHPVLLSTVNHVAFDSELPTSSAFNHMIVALSQPDARYVFLDPTDKGHAFGQPGMALHGQTALILEGPKAKLVTVPFPSPKQHGMVAEWTIAAKTAHLSATWTGLWAVGPGQIAETANRARVLEWVEDRFLSRWPAAHVASATVTESHGRIQLEAAIEHPGYESHVPVRWFYDDAEAAGLGAKRGYLRELPRHFEERVTLELPADARAISLPPAQEMKGEWGVVSWSAHHHGRSVQLERKIEVEAKHGNATEEVLSAIEESVRRAVSWTSESP
jgi:hypothetical protein